MPISESETRTKLIDQKLKTAGWDTEDCTQVVREFDIQLGLPDGVAEPRHEYDGHRFSDYVLIGKNGLPLAVVEAKKTTKDPEIGREQAKQYCFAIQKQYQSPLPFCFYTNGHEIYFWDIGNYPPRKVFGFPTRVDLERFLFIRENRDPLAEQLIKSEIAGRDYQIHAIRAILEGISEKKRKFLLVMATGTGKTRVCIGLIHALMRAKHVERILFLVDRISLREQALSVFKEHLPDEPRWPKDYEKAIAIDRRIYVSTYPSMLNIIRSDENPLSPHFFDLIVVDESHRSIYNTYGEILSYFNAMSLGLTATPTDVIDHNTFALFDCEDGVPTYAFSYDDALRHSPPFLCPFEVMTLSTRFQLEGINERTIGLEDQKKLILEGKEIDEIDFSGEEIEKTVTNKGTNVLIVREFMEECIKDSNGVLPGKTIFFCSSMAHARRIEHIFDDLYPEYSGELAKVLVSDDPRVYGKNGLLEQFKRNDLPRVAVSVDMLDTGIDVLEIVNLVFARPVFSYTKFWQMIGRGTRLLDLRKIKSWCTFKDRFLVIDCWDNFEFFKINAKGRDLSMNIPLPVRFFGIRVDKVEKAQSLKANGILTKEIQILREQIDTLPRNSVPVMEEAAALEKVKDDNFWINPDRDKLEYLRSTIKPLFRTVSQADFKAMRFQKDVLEASLALLEGENGKFENLAAGIAKTIGFLPLSINFIAKEEALIREAQTPHYWATVTDGKLDELSARLSPLMRHAGDGLKTEQVRLDLRDAVIKKDRIEFGPEHEATSVAQYREMVEERVRELLDTNLVLQKIRDGKKVSAKETEELADVLARMRPHVTEELFRRVYENRKATFLQFIRHIMGLERIVTFPESVENAFTTFIREHSNMNTNQLLFLETLKNFLFDHERVERRDLIQSPFTQIHPQGIRGLFTNKEIDEIIDLTQKLAG